MKLTIEVHKNDEYNYTARCNELELYCFGKNENEVCERMTHIINFYFLTLDELGLELEINDREFIESNFFSTEKKYTILNQNNLLQ
ncbi:MAG: hypothetical protein AB1765_12260 [Candidatus Hydrogenedentota bacterium]